MNDDREIQDTPIDRSAATIVLRAAGEQAPVTEDGATIDAAWRRCAGRIAAVDDETFGRMLDRIEAVRDDTDAPVMARVDDLVAHLIDWRHVSWEAADGTAGHDRHRIA